MGSEVLTEKKLRGIFKEGRHIFEKQSIRDEGKEKFNIFETLRIERKEVGLHSYFIYELINPKAEHGLGMEFFKIFKEEVLREIEEENQDKLETDDGIKVEREHLIQANKKRIDFLIDIGNYLIAIEMKIDTQDSYEQINDYYKYVKKSAQSQKKNFRVLYLTLEGEEIVHELDEGVSYIRISFRNHMLSFINRSIEKSAKLPKLRESLIQYKETLEKMLNIIGGEMEKDLVELILQDDNMEIAEKIMNLYPKAKARVHKEYLEELVDMMKDINKDTCYEYDYMDKVDENEKWYGAFSKRKIDKKELKLGISFDVKSDLLYLIFGNSYKTKEKDLAVELGFKKNNIDWYYKYLDKKNITEKIRNKEKRKELTRYLQEEYSDCLKNINEFLKS